MIINGKEVKFIKDYGNWILVQYPEGYKEGINKQELGLVKEKSYKGGKKRTPILRGVFGARV